MLKAFSAAKVLGKASWTLEVRMTAPTDRHKMQLFVNGSRQMPTKSSSMRTRKPGENTGRFHRKSAWM
jgi:hypothetical protein